ncbi:Bug family tripartite tricarboxylate transporter substrate binding protein [Aquabacterium sp.]|uniref:Bug family tripartite tricarboxylate transporter substrate binding protein n=1 Tax=Aquabacterium sp. TaxID=1872578 RepID=UPI002B9F909C|nr:tripartite tricarboxylate transporter substrate binding protein [Aquabacterium sp.]HSW04678.1 tripartite tricarboxylate transporter substrate binding protein [Aquabacterium sp.]
MESFRLRGPRRLLALIAGLGATLAAAAEEYPARPITLIVGYTAGGTTDSVARPFAEVLGRVLKTKVVVDNVAGAGGALGAQKVVIARPDGYTLLLGANGELIATGLANPKQPYDGQRDLVPIGLVSHQGGVLLASRQVGVKTTEQFIQLLRKHPGKYNYATSGVGSMFHVAGEILRERTGTQLTHVAYRGASGLGNDLAGGTVEFGFMGTAPAKSFIESGVVVPIAVTSATRSPLYPNVPALAEFPELKGYNLSGWFALMAPKTVPEPIIARLRAALKEALQDGRLRQSLTDLGGLPAADNEDLPKLMRDEHLRYKKFIETTQLDTQK